MALSCLFAVFISYRLYNAHRLLEKVASIRFREASDKRVSGSTCKQQSSFFSAGSAKYVRVVK